MNETSLMKCDYCDERLSLENGDYEAHLTVVHEIKNGEMVEEILANAVENLKSNQAVKDKEIEEITIDDSDDELSDDDQHVPHIKPVKNETGLGHLEDSINNMFNNLNLIIDGMKPDLSEIDEDYDDGMENDTNELPEELGKCFDKLRNIFDNLDIPSSVFYPVEVNSTTTKHVKEDNPKPKKHTKDNKKADNFEKKNKSSRTVYRSGQTLYLCPFSNCDYITTKQGFKNNEAALHLGRDHKVTPEDMVPGKYKFDKIK